MCRRNSGPSKEDTERRHQEQMDLQKEQMRIQQEQFEKNLELQRERFEEQQAAATAEAPPPPEPIAEATASTTEIAAATAEPAPVYIDDPTMQGANPTAGEGSAMMTIQAPGLQPVIKAGRGKKGYKTSGRLQAGGTGSLMIPNT